MPRPLRIEYPGAVYHVMARGNHGQRIFKDAQDYKRFLETLEQACDKTGWRVHALLRFPGPTLSAGGRPPSPWERDQGWDQGGIKGEVSMSSRSRARPVPSPIQS